MIKYSMKNVHDQKIDQWINLGVNVMLIGDRGTGKTQRILEGFERNNLKHVYFSGATIDPWLHLIGVPEITGDAGSRALDFILPRNIDEDIEAIFIDEYNRTPKIVRNALLELQQFKTINGRKFPKLKLVWAAINPPKGEEEEGFQYDVDEPDPAQVDRFHVIVEIPSIPDPKYFKKRFGDYVGNILIKWWKDQSKTAQSAVSPRRLEYAGNYFLQGADLADLLPPCCNIGDLAQALSVTEEDGILEKIKADPTGSEAKNFLSKPENYLKVEKQIADPAFFPAYRFLNEEIQKSVLASNASFTRFVLAISVANPSEKWPNSLLDTPKLQSEKERISAVLGQDWPTTYCEAASLDPTQLKISLSRSEGNDQDSLSKFNQAISNGNYNIPKNYYSSILERFDSKSFANTYWHKKVVYFLRGCHSLVPPVVLMNVVLSIYQSLQVKSLQEFSGFEKLFNSIFFSAYNRLSAEERINAAKLFNSMTPRHEDFAKIQKAISASATQEFCGVLPKAVDDIIKSALEA